MPHSKSQEAIIRNKIKHPKVVLVDVPTTATDVAYVNFEDFNVVYGNFKVKTIFECKFWRLKFNLKIQDRRSGGTLAFGLGRMLDVDRLKSLSDFLEFEDEILQKNQVRTNQVGLGFWTPRGSYSSKFSVQFLKKYYIRPCYW